MTTPALLWHCRDRVLRFDGRPLIMGILNVTPDSFSDGGLCASAEQAIARGLAMARDGADIVDVGGESTRPGAAPVPADEEIRRIAPVVGGLARALRAEAAGREAPPPLISIDTRKAVVAEAALASGASVINDVTALTGDPAMADLARRHGAGVVLMHMRGDPATMQKNPRYTDVVGEVADYLAERIRALCAAGVDPAALAVDPGIGFGKTPDHNVALFAKLERLRSLGRPIVVGLSRKSFLGTLTGRDVNERLAGSLAAMTLAAAGGAHVLRVHDVRASVDAARVVAAWRSSRTPVVGKQEEEGIVA